MARDLIVSMMVTVSELNVREGERTTKCSSGWRVVVSGWWRLARCRTGALCNDDGDDMGDDRWWSMAEWVPA